MNPIFTVCFGPNTRGTKVIVKKKFFDKDFLSCNENKGCERCRPVE